MFSDLATCGYKTSKGDHRMQYMYGDVSHSVLRRRSWMQSSKRRHADKHASSDRQEGLKKHWECLQGMLSLFCEVLPLLLTYRHFSALSVSCPVEFRSKQTSY